MKLKDILDKVLDSTTYIEENCGRNNLVHTCFGYSEVKEEEHLFMLMEDGKEDDYYWYDTNQEVEIDETSVKVKDINGNVSELYFMKAEPQKLI